MEWDRVTAETLFHLCAGSDQSAWGEFVTRYGELIERTAFRIAQRRSNPTRGLLDDLVQECFLKLCADNGRVLRAFRSSHPGSEFGYLKVVTAHSVIDYFRRRGFKKAEVSLTDAPELETEGRDANRRLILREVEECLDDIAKGVTRERDKSVFFLYYGQGLSARAISTLPSIGLTCEGVESLLGRLTRSLRERLTSPARKAPAAGESI